MSKSVGVNRTFRIDRSKPFNPNNLKPKSAGGWRIVEEDEDSKLIKEINLDQVSLLPVCGMLTLTLNGVRLDCYVFHSIWNTIFDNPDISPVAWREKEGEWFLFQGTKLQSPGGGYYYIGITYKDGGWNYYLVEETAEGELAI